MEFEVLYSKHKKQKRKTWCDGFLVLSQSSRQLVLLDEERKEVESCRRGGIEWIKDESEWDSNVLDLGRNIVQIISAKKETVECHSNIIFKVKKKRSNWDIAGLIRSQSSTEHTQVTQMTQSNEPKRRRTGFLHPAASKRTNKETLWSVRNDVISGDIVSQLSSILEKRHADLNLPAIFPSVYEYSRVMRLSVQRIVLLSIIEKIVDYRRRRKELNSCSVDLRASTLRRHGISLYISCHVKKRANYFKGESTGKTTRRLHFGNDFKGKSSEFSKGDIFVLSVDDSFAEADKFVLLHSLQYGYNKGDLSIAVDVIDGRLDVNERYYALRCSGLSLAVSMISALEGIAQHPPPVTEHLLRPCSEESKVDPIESDADEYNDLNNDQQLVVRDCLGWKSGGRHVVVVHGPFGSGKTYLLVSLILTLLKKFEQKRILVCGVTNIAVDNILVKLLEKGFDDFIRVGSRKKIAKVILSRTIGAEKETEYTAAIREVEELMSEETSLTERKHLEEAIKEYRDGRLKKQRDSVRTSRVVGVTCAAASFPVLQTAKFDIAIIDEATQCLEPLAMIPIQKLQCEYLVLCGDPLQLPPQVPRDCTDKSITRSLFTRVVESGNVPILLRKQHRCHPIISKIANEVFYNNILEDGISENDRLPMIQELPTFMFVDCSRSGKESSSHDGSFTNEHESEVIIHLTNLILKAGVEPENVGVIGFYKSQVWQMRNGIKNFGVKVSTVDAFQGGEKEIILLSCCRTVQTGFLNDPNRINVAITRARRNLIVVGNARTLREMTYWARIIHCGCKWISGADVFLMKALTLNT